VANRHEQILSIGRENDLPARLAAPAPGHLAPQHSEIIQSRHTSGVQLGAGQRLSPAIVTRLYISDIDTLVGGVMGREEDAQHAVLALPIDRGRVSQRRDLFSLRGYQPNGPDLFG